MAAALGRRNGVAVGTDKSGLIFRRQWMAHLTFSNSSSAVTRPVKGVGVMVARPIVFAS